MSESAPSLATPAPTKESCSEDESSSDADEESTPESEETLKKGGSTLKGKQKNGENKKTFESTWGQKAVYIRRNLPTVERVLKILKLIVISPHDSIKCQSWEGFEKIAFYHYKKAHFYTVGQNQFF